MSYFSIWSITSLPEASSDSTRYLFKDALILFSLEGLTQEELDSNYRKLLMGFYQMPRISWYYTKFTLKHPQHFLRLLTFFGLMLRSKVRDKMRALGGQETLHATTSLD